MGASSSGWQESEGGREARKAPRPGCEAGGLVVASATLGLQEGDQVRREHSARDTQEAGSRGLPTG